MSEIDFAEIERAMAELVNKAQGKERKQGLKVVSKDRSDKAKAAEVAHEQGDIATKRIIVASNKMRANPHPHPQPQPNPAPVFNSSPTGRVMDFKAPSAPPDQPSPTTLDDNEDLNRTVGELSNEYLIGKVSEPEEPALESTPAVVTEDALPNGAEDPTTQGAKDKITSSLEDIAGPSPVMSVMQEPSIASSDVELEKSGDKGREPSKANKLPKDIGKVHKIYGQRLPKEYLTSLKSTAQNKKNETSSPGLRQKNKRGFSFYFVAFMIVAALAVWGFAAYLYFMY